MGNKIAILAMALLIVMQIAFTYAAPMQAVFATAALDAAAWTLIVGLAVMVLWLLAWKSSSFSGGRVVPIPTRPGDLRYQPGWSRGVDVASCSSRSPSALATGTAVKP